MFFRPSAQIIWAECWTARPASPYSSRTVSAPLAVLVVVGALGWRLATGGESPCALGVLGLLAAQITLGVLNVLLALPLWVATAHNAGGALLLLALVTVRHCIASGAKA